MSDTIITFPGDDYAPAAVLSPAEQRYSDDFRAWHEAMRASAGNPDLERATLARMPDSSSYFEPGAGGGVVQVPADDTLAAIDGTRGGSDSFGWNGTPRLPRIPWLLLLAIAFGVHELSK